MLSNKLAVISLISLSASAILIGGTASAQTVNQEINGRAIGPDTYVNGNNLTINPTGTLNQLINCEARNNNVPIDPRCDASNTAIYGSKHNTTPDHPPSGGNHNSGGHDIKQTVHQGGTNTTVITPNTANSSSKSYSGSSSTSDANATIRDSGNSSNTNLNVSRGGNAKIGDVNSSATSNVGGQKNQQSVTTGATSVSTGANSLTTGATSVNTGANSLSSGPTSVSPNISPSTRVKVDGDQYNSIQFGSQAPGSGGEAFAFQYRSACGTGVSYRQGFALKPKRIGGGGFGYALDISNTDMDTIENRSGVQNKMNTAFQAAMNVVNTQQTFEQRLGSGRVSRQEAETYAIANCAPQPYGVSNTNTQGGVQITHTDKPRTCTSRGCN